MQLIPLTAINSEGKEEPRLLNIELIREVRVDHFRNHGPLLLIFTGDMTDGTRFVPVDDGGAIAPDLPAADVLRLFRVALIGYRRGRTAPLPGI